MRRRTSGPRQPTKRKKRWPLRKPRRPFPSKLRSVFFGTSTFAVPSLDALADETDCVLVVTQPDRPAGRGKRLTPTPVMRRARELGLPTLEPLRVREVLDEVQKSAAALFGVASYGKILPAELLAVPALGALNVHPSLLPLYRGATPLQSQLRDGVRRSGVSIILMDAGMDTGDIVAQREIAVGEYETYGELHDRLASLGAQALSEALALAPRQALHRRAQAGLASEAAIAATLTRPLSREDFEIDWSASARAIVDTVRSLSPEPLARARFAPAGEFVKIVTARLPDDAGPGALLVACGLGDAERVAIERVVPPNRSAMSGAEFGRFAALAPA